jgi:hypothetical protein
MAWTLAGVVGALLIAGAVSALGALFDFLDQFGLAPSSSVLEFIANMLVALCLSLTQLFVLRVVLGHRSGASRAWVPVSTLVFTLEYFVGAYWFRNAPSEVAFVESIVQGVLLAVAQGLVLAEMLRLRSAVWIWLGGMVMFYLAMAGVLSTRLVDLNSFVGVIVLGFGYGAISGAAATTAVRRSAMRRLTPPPEGAVDPI